MNKSIISWALYDVANTAFNLGVVGLFLPLWINHRHGTTDADLGFPIAISMCVVLTVSPFLGALNDQLRGRVPTLTVLNIIAVATMFLIGSTDTVHVGLVFFSISFVCVYLAELVYNAMLAQASTPHNRGKVGGLAIGLGYLGSLAIIALALQYQDANSDYSFEFQAIAGFFFLMALPITLFYKEHNTPPDDTELSMWNSAWNQIKSTRRYLRENPNITKFFIARYFYMISVTTGSTFGVLYGIKTVGFTERQVELVLLVGILVSIPSAASWGYIVDRMGAVFSLKWILLGWVLVFLGSVSIPWLHLSNQLWWPLGAMTGLFYGGIWVADRPLLIQLSPSNLGEMFGIYGAISRLAFLTGSLVWSLVAVSMGLGQPASVFFLLCCTIVALGLVTRLQRKIPTSRTITP